MQNVNNEQWQEWRANKVTTAVMEAVKLRLDEAVEKIVTPYYGDRDFDQFVKGMAVAFQEVLDIQLDLTTEEELNEIQERDTDGQSYS